MKIVYHLLVLAAVAGSFYYFGISPLAALEFLPAAWITGSCLFCGLVAEKPRLTARALLFLLADKAGGGKKIGRLLRLWGQVSLLSGGLLLLIAGLVYFANAGQNPVVAGKAVGAALLGPAYGIYLYLFAFLPFSNRAVNAGS